MTQGTMELIQRVTVGSGGQAAIEFTNIAQTYNDLKIVLSARSTGTESSGYADAIIRFNTTTTNYSERMIYGIGTTDASASQSADGIKWFFGNSSVATASTFGNSEAYIPDYRSSNNKSVSIDTVAENNSASANIVALNAGLWSNSAAITSISITPGSGVWAQHTTATLYGMTRIPAGAKATGGMIYDDASFWYHVFTSSGTFTPSQNLSCDVLAIGGGGGSGNGTNVSAGGGAGGLLYATSKSFAGSTNFTVTIGAGGGPDASGANTTIDNITAFGGGRGGDESTAGGNGGSGGGSTWAPGLNTPGTSTQTNNGGGTGYGNAGGSSATGAAGNLYPSGGGGGAGGAGQNGDNTVAARGGNGGIGLGGNTIPALNAFGAATSTGVLSGGNYYYAGGGGGGSWEASTTWSSGGLGGGGRGGAKIAGGDNPADGLANTGGGGGGNGASSVSGRSGGSGIVIVRYAK